MEIVGEPPIGSIPRAQALIGGPAALRGLTTLIEGTNDRMVGDAFRLTHRPAVGAVEDLLNRGGSARFLIGPHTEGDKVGMSQLEPGGAQYVRNNKMVHGKAFAFDGRRGWIGTAPVDQATMYRNDSAVQFDGEPAAQLDHLLSLALDHSKKSAIRDAAAAAAQHGILLNDPRSGAQTLTDAVEQLIIAPQFTGEQLLVATKSLRDPRIVELLAQAAERGDEVHVTTRDVGRDSVGRLRDAGVHLELRLDPLHHNHANLISRGGQFALIGSAHLTPRALDREGGRRSLEMGALVSDPQAVADIRSSIAALFPSHPVPVEAVVLSAARERWLRERRGKGYGGA